MRALGGVSMIGLTRQLVFVACEGEPAVPTRRPDLRDVTPMKSQEVTMGPHHIRVQRRASLRLRLLCIFSVVVLMGVSSATGLPRSVTSIVSPASTRRRSSLARCLRSRIPT